MSRRLRQTRIVASAVSLLVLGWSSLSAQQGGTVTGRISSPADQPVAGARVILRHTRHSVFTDSLGRFEITGVAAGRYTLAVEHTAFVYGQENLAVSIGEATDLQVQLEPVLLPVEELVLAGTVDPAPGSRLPLSLGRLSAAQLEVPAGGSMMTAIAGKLPGVTVLGRSGQLAPGVSLMLRSQSSGEGMAPMAPLIVVDGVILARETGDTDLDIDPADIASIEVLKGAAASAATASVQRPASFPS